MSAPSFLFFDLGNVLVSFCNDRMIRQIAAVAGVAEGGVREALFRAGEGECLQWRFERGDFSDDEYFDQVCAQLGVRPDRRAFDAACADIFEPIQASLSLAQRLAASGRRLGILSNTNAIHWRLLTDGRFPAVNDAFELHVTSFAARAMKPDRAIYDLAAVRAGSPIERVFFTDDREDNVAGALAAGMDAVRFTSTAELERELRLRGVL